MESASTSSIEDHVEARIRWLPILKLQECLPILSDWTPDPQDASILIPPAEPPSATNDFQPSHVGKKPTGDKDRFVELFERTCCLGMLSTTCTAKDIEQRINVTLQSHRICITAGGSIALVPAGAKPDDLICVLPGADLPLVFRKVQKTKGTEPSAKEYDTQAYFWILNSNINGKLKGLLRDADLEWGFKTLDSVKGVEEDEFYFVGEAYCKTSLSVLPLSLTLM